MQVVHITQDNFDREVLHSPIPVLMDFWAGWCGPCRMLSPVLDEIAESSSDVKVAKVNVDEVPQLAKDAKVTSIPTLVLYKEGKMVDSVAGPGSKAAIEQFIQGALAK